jgi:hypothetical protein
MLHPRLANPARLRRRLLLRHFRLDLGSNLITGRSRCG